MTDFKTYQMNNTDKQLQTVYVLTLGQENKARIIINYAPPVYAKEIPNVYLYTPEELEALKAEWQMDAIISDRKLLRQNNCFKVPLLPKPITPTS